MIYAKGWGGRSHHGLRYGFDLVPLKLPLQQGGGGSKPRKPKPSRRMLERQRVAELRRLA